MRVPQWFLVIWVVFSFVFSGVGSYVSYTQAQERTRDMSEIFASDEEIDLARIGKLLLGLEEPDLVKAEDEDFATPTQVAIEPSATPAPTSDVPTATSDPNATSAPVTPTVEVTTAPEATAPAFQPWQDPRRVTVLLLGIDQRTGEVGPFRTDTMIVLSIDPIGKTAAMLSIPRDLWISYPSIGDERINNANVIGEQRQLPGGGPEFAKRTVSRVIGIPIDYYVMVNFDAFMTLVNVIGDVEVCPPTAIDDDHYPDGSYGILTIHFDAGCQTLPAERLLQYSRTRATEGGDVDRAHRQQEVIFAVREKILTAGGVFAVVSNPLTLWDAVKDNVRTDISVNQLVELALLAETIPGDNIRNGQISYGETIQKTLASGEQVLVPIQSDILALVGDLFRPAGTPSSLEQPQQ